jgi:hypothetical protein
VRAPWRELVESNAAEDSKLSIDRVVYLSLMTGPRPPTCAVWWAVWMRSTKRGGATLPSATWQCRFHTWQPGNVVSLFRLLKPPLDVSHLACTNSVERKTLKDSNSARALLHLATY